jgi:two-component system, chemotaxis family, response regulator Rcp1
MATNPHQVLLVEDNPDDIWLIKRAFSDNYPQCILHIVEDGVEAVAFLRRHGKYVDAPRPDLILLDLKLPKKDGGEVLIEIKTDQNLKRIPVIILTSSDLESDILRSYATHANAYIQKPTVEPFSGLIRRVVDFWLTTVSLPPTQSGSHTGMAAR